MLHRRRRLVLATIGAFIVYFFVLPKSRIEVPSHVIQEEPASGEPVDEFPRWNFSAVTLSPGSNYTRTLVIPRLTSENVSWIAEELPDLDTAIYVVNDPNAPLHPPKNKGNEAMVYLTYIIDHYESLPDIMIFMHAHRFSWHNNDILGNDAVQMIKRLSSEHVMRQGYVNLRCHWKPGCPDWLQPKAQEEDIVKQEQLMLKQSWPELFPLDPLPTVLAQPCCSQFALTRERVLSVPKPRFVYFRDWLLRTPLSTYISGRIWEYIWQFIFTGQTVVCPVMHICYCDAYGVCFNGEREFNKWFKLRYERSQLVFMEKSRQLSNKMAKDPKAKGLIDGPAGFDYPDVGEDSDLKDLGDKIRAIRDELQTMIDTAIERGRYPRNRALAAGREWKEGDGF
ncbi:hypothetical protein GP486_003785 [Trichoglossum hirsutum]|uniref:Uncharacterized protein n=1 Tax=Trichoglossum hirsutum TaxID=265104 RepID=A0A9P8LC82_9PEZI|nr:hypothetical protein GP486_003785 [Trichoglossum hirsutum]